MYVRGAAFLKFQKPETVEAAIGHHLAQSAKMFFYCCAVVHVVAATRGGGIICVRVGEGGQDRQSGCIPSLKNKTGPALPGQFPNISPNTAALVGTLAVGKGAFFLYVELADGNPVDFACAERFAILFHVCQDKAGEGRQPRRPGFFYAPTFLLSSGSFCKYVPLVKKAHPIVGF